MYVMTAVPVAIIIAVSLFIPFFASRHMLLPLKPVIVMG